MAWMLGLMFLLPLPTTASEAGRQVRFSWEVAPDYEGDLIVQLTVVVPPMADCLSRFFVAFENNDSVNALHTGSSQQIGWTAAVNRPQVQAHIGGLDTREARSTGSAAGFSAWTFELGLPDEDRVVYVELLFVGIDLTLWREEWGSPFRIEILCQGDATVEERWGGRHVVPFTSDTLEGVGVSAADPLWGAATASVGVKDVLDWTSLEGRRNVFQFMSTQAMTRGTVELYHAFGSTTWLIDENSRLTYHGPRGSYRMEATHVSAGPWAGFIGVLGAMDPVQDLNDVASVAAA